MAVAVQAWRQRTPAQRERILLWLILGVAGAVQLALAPYRGFFLDMQYYLRWAQVFIAHPWTIYTASDAAYPPLTLYLFAGLLECYRGVGHVLGFTDAQLIVRESTRFATLWFVAKLPSIGANVGSAYLVYRLARPMVSARMALLATAAYAFSPALIFDGAVWGQTDGISVFLTLLAVVALLARRPVWAGLVLGAMVMIKPQPAIFIPLLLLYLLLTAGWRDMVKATLAMVGAILVICAPYLLPPRPQIFAIIHNVAPLGQGMTWNALNVWFLVGPMRPSDSRILGPLTAAQIGVALFIPIYCLALALVWRLRSLEALYMAMALTVIGAFEVAPAQHERYIFPSLALLLLAGVYQTTFVRYFVIASFTSFSNMLVAAVFEGSYPLKEPLLDPLWPFFWNPPTVPTITIALNMLLLGLVIATCIARLRGRLRGLPITMETAASAPLATPLG